MKGMKMILLVTSLGMSMFFLQGYGSADDGGIWQSVKKNSVSGGEI